MKLNLKQKKILKLLSINCRFTNKDIAKSLGISEDSVAYQIDKLISKDKLAKFNIQFFHPMLGYDSYHIWLRLKKGNIEKIKEIDEVHSINKSQGRFDYQLLVFSKDKKEFLGILNKIKKIVYVQGIKFSKLEMASKSFSNIIPPINVNIKIPNNNRKFEYVLNTEQYPLGNFSKRISLDMIDKKIIKNLLKNPRASFQELSKLTKINHETIRYRMRNYVKEKIITNFGLIHDFQKYGLFVNYFLINVNKKELNEREFLNYLNSKINIFYCAKLKGDYDYIVYVASGNPSELGEINNDLMLSLGDSIKGLDLLFMGETIKYGQFPVKILE
jgi:Lrp/AsnC family transcriptional regulator, leucine-responsive regulatory protein